MTTTDPTEAGRALNARRRRQTYRCEQCGKPFEAIRQTGERTPRTCSPTCRSKLRYYRNKEARAT